MTHVGISWRIIDPATVWDKESELLVCTVEMVIHVSSV